VQRRDVLRDRRRLDELGGGRFERAGEREVAAIGPFLPLQVRQLILQRRGSGWRRRRRRG
jgi:hypothetical protein